MTKYTFVKSPVVHLIADTQQIISDGLGKSLKARGADVNEEECLFYMMLPENNRYASTSAEKLCEGAGKLCYNAFGKNGSTKTTKEYLSNSVYDSKPFGHLSIAYHAHFSLYISGISRRLSHELLRHYIGVGASEGSPSQMSTRYVIHPPRFVVHPGFLNHLPSGCDPSYTASAESIKKDTNNFVEYIDFKRSCKSAYRHYRKLVDRSEGLKGLAKKRVLERAASALPQSVETSLILTMNPISARKMIVERTGDTADLEFRRLALKIRSVLETRYKAFQFR